MNWSRKWGKGKAMHFLARRRRTLLIGIIGLAVLGTLLNVVYSASAHAYPVKTEPAGVDFLAAAQSP